MSACRPGWYGNDLTEPEGGDTANIDLAPQQVDLVNAVTALGKPTLPSSRWAVLKASPQ